MRSGKIRIIMGCLVVVGLCWGLPVAAEVGLGVKAGMLIPDRDPFKDMYDSDIVLGGVLEFDSNMGITLEADVEYYRQRGDGGGEITLYPIVLMMKYNLAPRYRTTPFVGLGVGIVLMMKYNLAPRYRTTPFVGLGVGAYFFDRETANGVKKAKTRYGTRVAGGLRFMEDRRANLVFEAARNFVDVDNMNASSFEITFSLIFDLYANTIGAP